MEELLIEVAKIRTNKVHEAAYLHHGLVEIHPFTDGNGRVARLISNLVLMKSGFPPVVLRKDDHKKYYDCLRKADFGNIRSFVDFIGRALDESLTLFISIFGGKNALVPLSELAKDSPYSQEYLSLRARQGILSAVKMERVWHSSKKELEDYIERYGK